MSRLLLAAAAWALAPALRSLGVRFFVADLDRMGDTCLQLDVLIKARRLGWGPEARIIVIPQPAKPIGNPTLLQYFGRYVRIVTARRAYALLFRLAQRPGMRLESLVVNGPGGHICRSFGAVIAVQRHWEAEGRPPLLSLDPKHRDRGRALLESLGMPRDAWFACLHAREPGWLDEDETSKHRHTNADVLTYLPAVARIVARGGWVVRMGDRSMKQLPSLERVIDYAHNPGRSDWMDVFLAAECRFFLGSTSGLFTLPFVFGRPVALANWHPLPSRPFAGHDLFTPKLYRSTNEGRVLSFRESTSQPFTRLVHADRFAELGIALVDNEPSEIVKLVEEMIDQIEGLSTETSDVRALRSAFDALCPDLPYGPTSRIGASFILQHRELLEDPPPTSEPPRPRRRP